MRSPTKQNGTDRRAAERTATVKGERRTSAEPQQQQGGVVTSMVDALEDILKWERASERAMRIATAESTTELDPSN